MQAMMTELSLYTRWAFASLVYVFIAWTLLIRFVSFSSAQSNGWFFQEFWSRFEDTLCNLLGYFNCAAHLSSLVLLQIFVKMASFISLLLAALAASSSATIENPSVSPRPPMGFNNWARFMCN